MLDMEIKMNGNVGWDRESKRQAEGLDGGKRKYLLL